MYHDKGIYLTQYEGIMERQYTYSHSRAVWDATTDEVVQRTNYYPSGMPMAQSTGQSVQPLKYNAHEYIEAHGYDVYDYGFRGYYATIGRFTSIDPLCERTPWQSPYAYANNNWINQIDILGLAGVKYVLSGLQKRGYIVIDKNGDFIGGVNDSDLSIYLSDDGNWQEENGTEGLERVGLMNKSYADYMAELLQNNGKIQASGVYYARNCIYITIRFGLSVQKSFGSNLFSKQLSTIGINLCSFDLLSFTLQNGNLENVDYYGKDGKATVSHGVAFSLFGVEETFKVRANDELSYIPATTETTVSLIDNNQYVFSPSFGNFITISITIVLNKYYEQN